jgi:hypothetical protein
MTFSAALAKLAVDVGAEGPVELLRRELAYVIERGLVGSIVDQDVKPAELLVSASYDLLAVFLVADIAAQQDRTTSSSTGQPTRFFRVLVFVEV